MLPVCSFEFDTGFNTQSNYKMLYYKIIKVLVIIGLISVCTCRHLDEAQSDASSSIDPQGASTSWQTDPDPRFSDWNTDRSLDTAVDVNTRQTTQIPVPGITRDENRNPNIVNRVTNDVQPTNWSPPVNQDSSFSHQRTENTVEHQTTGQTSMANNQQTDNNVGHTVMGQSEIQQSEHDRPVDHIITQDEVQVDHVEPIKAADNRIDPELVDNNIDTTDNHMEQPHAHTVIDNTEQNSIDKDRVIHNTENISTDKDQVHNTLENQASNTIEVTQHNINNADDAKQTHNDGDATSSTHLNNNMSPDDEFENWREDETTTHIDVMSQTTKSVVPTTTRTPPTTTTVPTTTTMPPTTTIPPFTGTPSTTTVPPFTGIPITTSPSTTTVPPTTTRVPGDVDPLDIFVDDIKFQRFPTPMDFLTFQTKILDRSFKKLYILEETDRKLFANVRQLEATYTMEGDELFVTFLFRFVFSRQCQEIQKFRLGKRVGNTNKAYFEKDLGNRVLERVMFFTEMPEDYVFFMSCTDRNTSPYACRDKYYVTLDSARDPPNQFPWLVASDELYRKMSLSFQDPRFIFNFVMTPCVRR